jgi:hypothetical protein
MIVTGTEQYFVDNYEHSWHNSGISLIFEQAGYFKTYVLIFIEVRYSKFEICQ